MGDILQRLRDRAKIQNATGGYPLDKANLSSAAADEIELLRTELASIKENYYLQPIPKMCSGQWPTKSKESSE